MKINVPNKCKEFNITEEYYNVNLTNKDIYYILASAVEGGINYWCDKLEGNSILSIQHKVEYSWEWLIYGGSLIFYADGKKHTLKLNNFQKGLQKWVNRHGEKKELVHYDSKTNLLKWIADIDADDADNIIQYGLFGKLVYC